MDIDRTANLDFAEIVELHGTRAPTRDSVFVINREDDGSIGEYTFGQFYDKSLQYGNMISRMRKKLGKEAASRFHLAVFMQNRPEFLFALGGCSFTNSTLVGINNEQVGEKLAFDINNIDVDMLIADSSGQPGTDRTFVETVLDARERFGFESLTTDRIFSQEETVIGIESSESLLERFSDTLPSFIPTKLRVEQPAIIIFTSGTTGAPKGIEVTWEKLIDVGVTSTEILNYDRSDTGYVCMPLNHSNSLYLNVMPALLNGAKIMLRRRFSSSNFVKDLEESRATVWNSVGDPVHYVLNHMERNTQDADFSHLPLRTVFSTGTNSRDRKLFSEMFGLEIFTEAYGSTEAGVVSAVDASTPHYSVGKLVKDARIIRRGSKDIEADYALVDDSGRITNLKDSAGEIVVSQESLGRSAFTGYYKLPAETSRRIVEIDGKDFYRMGDLGAIVLREKEKYLVFLGRAGDWVRCKGENWAPVDAERSVLEHAQVKNVAVIGVPQAVGTEDDPVFVVEPVDTEAFDIQGFCQYCNESLPRYMQPRFIRLVDSLPATETMKVKKHSLKHDFFYRPAGIDGDQSDKMYVIRNGNVHPFTSREFQKEMNRYVDPTNRDRLVTFTGRHDLFEG